jgi:hypothetical protein
LSSGDNQGGYDVVCKVQIERFDYIPNTIKLVGKTPKTNEKQKNAQATFSKSDSLPMQTSRCHQVLGHPFKHHGGLHIMVEWEHASKNVGLQHKVPTHSKQPNVLVAKRARYGKVNTTCHL